MDTDLPDTRSSESDTTDRRRLLTLLGAGGAAAAAAVVLPREAHAAHDATNVLHLGEVNVAPQGAATRVEADVGPFGNAALAVHNASGVGMRAVSGGTGTGVEGISDAGVGGAFATTSGKALQVDGVASIFADSAISFGGNHPALIVEQQQAGGKSISSNVVAGGLAIEGTAFPTDEELEFEDQQGGYGVRGIAMSATGGYGEGPGVGVHGQSGTGVGVLGITAGAGTGVEARTHSPAGTALLVNGPSRFSTVGIGVVPAGKSEVFVGDPGVTEGSHITVTLVSDPGVRSVHWVDRDPGSGFTVHLTSAPPNRRPTTTFSYFVVESV